MAAVAECAKSVGNEEHVKEWMGYQGDLPIGCDGTSNLGACASIIEFYGRRVSGGFASNGSIAKQKWSTGNYKPRITLKNIKVEALVKYGRFGNVWKATLGSELTVAISQRSPYKCKPTSIWMARDALLYLKSEKSPFVINLVGSFFDTDVFLLTEMCQCSVKDCIMELSDRNKQRFLVQLLKGLAFVHSKCIWHCAIMPSNLLITTANNLVLADFASAMYAPGVAKMINNFDSGVSYYQDYEANCLSTFGSKTDIWAAGCCLYEMSVGRCLMKYAGKHDVPKIEYGLVARYGKADCYSKVVDSLKAKRTPIKDKIISTKFGPFLKLMLTPTWESRYEANEVLLSHEFLNFCMEHQINSDVNDNDGTDVISLKSKRVPEQSLSFQPETEVDPSGSLVINWSGFYYDELENIDNKDNKPAFYRSLAVNAGPEYVRHLVSNGLLEGFLRSVAANDPVLFATFVYIGKESVELQRFDQFSNHLNSVKSLSAPEMVTSGTNVDPERSHDSNDIVGKADKGYKDNKNQACLVTVPISDKSPTKSGKAVLDTNYNLRGPLEHQFLKPAIPAAMMTENKNSKTRQTARDDFEASTKPTGPQSLSPVCLASSSSVSVIATSRPMPSVKPKLVKVPLNWNQRDGKFPGALSRPIGPRGSAVASASTGVPTKFFTLAKRNFEPTTLAGNKGQENKRLRKENRSEEEEEEEEEEEVAKPENSSVKKKGIPESDEETVTTHMDDCSLNSDDSSDSSDSEGLD